MEAHFWPSGRERSFPKFGDAPLSPQKDLIALLREKHRSNVHFGLYRIPGKDKIPRLGKDAQNLELGVEMHLLAADFDRDPHTPWESTEEAHKALRDALERCPLAGGYTTPRGLRLVWMLENPVPITDATPYLKRWYRILRQRGLNPDPACCHWTQLYLAPQIPKRESHLDLYALECDSRLDFAPKIVSKKQAVLPAPAIDVHPSVVTSTIIERLHSDPESRKRFGVYLKAEVSETRVFHVRCPDCHENSVWWLIIPEKGRHKYARCNHENSCGWWGHLYELRSANG